MKLGQVGDRSQKISSALLMSLTVAYGEKKTEKYKNGSNVVSAVLLKDPSDDNIKYGCEGKHQGQLGGYTNKLGKKGCTPELIEGSRLTLS